MNVRKVLWCAEELNLKYESIPAGREFGLANEATYLAKTPMATSSALSKENSYFGIQCNRTLFG